MNVTTRWRRSANVTAVIAFSFAAIFALSACTGSVPSATASTAPIAATAPTPTKEAYLFTKDVNLCIENKSRHDVTIAWTRIVNSHNGSGVLPDRQTYCGEGDGVQVNITFWDSFTTKASADNVSLTYPFVVFNSVDSSELYDSHMFASGESFTSYFKNHQLLITRHPNDDWIQFTITIVD